MTCSQRSENKAEAPQQRRSRRCHRGERLPPSVISLGALRSIYTHSDLTDFF